MTIAAGFQCADGVVLCADSQETTLAGFRRAVVKVEWRPKTPQTGDKCRVIFSGAGDSVFIDRLITEMWRAVDGMDGTPEEISQRMESAATTYTKRCWGVYPAGHRILPEAQLLFGIWTPKGLGLFKADGHIVNAVTRYETIGCGGPLANYICDPAVEPAYLAQNWRIRPVIMLAAFMLEQVKQHVEGCGGESHIAVLHMDGRIELIPPLMTGTIGTHLVNCEKVVRPLVSASADLESVSDHQFGLLLDSVVDWMKILRRQHRKTLQTIPVEIDKASRMLRRQISKIVALAASKQPKTKKRRVGKRV